RPLYRPPHPPPADLYPLSLHDALPICRHPRLARQLHGKLVGAVRHHDAQAACAMDLRRGRSTALDTDVRARVDRAVGQAVQIMGDRKSTRLNSSHVKISYAVFCLKKKI